MADITSQPSPEKRFTLDELQKVMEPQYQVYKVTMRQCIAGLTEHAARLAAQDQEESLPRLRQLCIEMAEFWGLTEDDTPKGYQEMADHFGNTFDQAVSAAQGSGQAPELSAQTKENILDGLKLYAQEMRLNDEKLEDWAVECDILAEDLEEQWQLETAAAEQTAPQMNGMNL